MDKLSQIRKIYEEAIKEENACLIVYEGSDHTMGLLKDIALENLHIATARVETLDKVLNILENN